MPLSPQPSTVLQQAPIEVTITHALSTDAAQALTKYKLTVLIPATETDGAQLVSFTQGSFIDVTITPATEANVAQALNVDKYKTLGFASEVD
jgi:hypothetical protein